MAHPKLCFFFWMLFVSFGHFKYTYVYSLQDLNGAQKCHNPNIGFVTKCEMQGPMRLRLCLGVKDILTNGGECKG
jgi:hypothetical protein